VTEEKPKSEKQLIEAHLELLTSEVERQMKTPKGRRGHLVLPAAQNNAERTAQRLFFEQLEAVTGMRGIRISEPGSA
jgi:hypothetical protein